MLTFFARISLVLFAPLGLMAACAQFPDLSKETGALNNNAPFPSLLPLDQLNSSLSPETDTDAAINTAPLETKAQSIPTNALTDEDRLRLTNALVTP